MLNETNFSIENSSNVEQERKLSNILLTKKPGTSIDPVRLEDESKSRDEHNYTEISEIEENFESSDIMKAEETMKPDLKKKQVDQKEAKIGNEANKKVNKVAPLYAENFEEKKMAADKKSKDTTPKLPLSDNRIRQEDMKKKSFAQNNGRKYGKMDEELKNPKNKENKETKGQNGTAARNAKDTKDLKKIERTPIPSAEVKKTQPKTGQNQVEEKEPVMKKVIDRRTGKIIQIRTKTEKSATNVKNKDTTKTGLRPWKSTCKIEPIMEEPEPEPSNEDAKKNKKGTNVKPFSFEAREKEFLKKKQMFAKVSACQRKGNEGKPIHGICFSFYCAKNESVSFISPRK